jgi:hypothetical protein
MKKITNKQLCSLLQKHGFDPRIGWLCNQFPKKFKKEAWIDNTNWFITADKLISFLEKKKIKEILFFQEPYDHPNVTCILKIKELKPFFKKRYVAWTNNHFADKNLKWIVAITHEGDTRISGDKDFVKEASKALK